MALLWNEVDPFGNLRGSVSIYQGEELGLTEADIPRDKMVDPSGIALWPEVKTRDGCRTPMVWTRDNRNGGFSEGEPWLPVPPEHLQRAVSELEDAPDSLLNFYRRLIALRPRPPALVKGTLRFFDAGREVLAMERDYEGERWLCVFNLSENPAVFDLPDGLSAQAADGALFAGRAEAGRIALKGHDGFIGRLG